MLVEIACGVSTFCGLIRIEFHISLKLCSFDSIFIFIHKTNLVFKSLIGEQMTAFNRGGQSNEFYEIEPGLPVTRAHIMSVLLFDRYELLGYQYIKRGCNRLNMSESILNAKERNQEIGHWYRLLREVVLFFGEQTSSNDNASYYSSHAHGSVF